MWDIPRSRIKPRSPALAGRFFTTEPPGKPYNCILKITLIYAENISGSYITNQLYGVILTAYPLAEFEFFTRLCIIVGSSGWDVSPTVYWMKAERPPPWESTPSQPLTRTYKAHKGKAHRKCQTDDRCSRQV